MAEEKQLFFKGPSIANDAQTGLSHFILSTTYNDKKNQPVTAQLHGLLSELPEMSFTVNYEEGPGSEWQDLLSNFMANDLMSIFNALGAKGDNFTNLIKAGTWTKQVYAGYAPSTIPLKFRIYTTDTLGQTDAETWIAMLSEFATIASENEFGLGTAFKNIVGSVINAYNTGGDVAEIANKNAEINMKHTKPGSTKTEEEQNGADAFKKQMEVTNAQNALTKFFNNTMASVNQSSNKFKIAKMGFSSDSSTVGLTQYICFNLKLTTTLGGGSYGTKNPVRVGVSMKKNVLFGPETDVNAIKLECDKIETAIKDIVAKSGDDKAELEKIFNGGFYENMKRVYSDSTMETPEPEESKIAKFLKDTSKQLGNVMVSKYGPNRVYESMNRTNALGQKLWHLNLYSNVIFSSAKPLIVYISEWSVKPSEEMIGDLHVYYDFEITCAMDQVYSRDTWFENILNFTRKEIKAKESPWAIAAKEAAAYMENYNRAGAAAAAAMAGYTGAPRR